MQIGAEYLRGWRANFDNSTNHANRMNHHGEPACTVFFLIQYKKRSRLKSTFETAS